MGIHDKKNFTAITILLPIELKDETARIAKETGYSLAHYARIALQEKLERK